MVVRPLTWLGKLLRAISDIGRLSESGLALTCVVIGAATGGSSTGGGDVHTSAGLGALLTVALAYHGVAFSLNEIIDLPIDRTNPGRAQAALVSGQASVTVAWIVVGLYGALSLGIELLYLDRRTGATAILFVGYAGLVGYDLLTKRYKYPVLHDLFLAEGCGALVCYASVRSGGLTVQSALAAAFVSLFVMLVNGVHGGLRDLHNDATHNGVTTAAALGAKMDDNGALVLPGLLVTYAWALSLAMGSVVVAALLVAPERHASVMTSVGAGLTTVAGLGVLARGLRHRNDPRRFRRHGAAHILTAYSPIVFVTALDGGWGMGVAVVAVMMTPLTSNPRLRAVWRSWFSRLPRS